MSAAHTPTSDCSHRPWRLTEYRPVSPLAGAWRMVSDESGRRGVLPGRRGHLTITFTGTRFSAEFITKRSSSWLSFDQVAVEGGLVTCTDHQGKHTTFAPAAQTKRHKEPKPPRFDLHSYVVSGRLIHAVAKVEKWPSPNREANGDDALVRGVCGDNGGWVRPVGMNPEPTPSLIKCPRCYPSGSGAT